MIRKLAAVICCLTILMGILTACGTGGTREDDDKLSIVATIFPEYDWVMQLLGERAQDVEVELLVDNGVDLHNYHATVDDIVKISNCDLFIYVGGESDDWVRDALGEAVNDRMVVIDCLQVLGDAAKEEEAIEGMQFCDHTEEDAEYDEHMWLSMRSAKQLCCAIRDALIQLDGAHRATYEANTEDYLAKLDALDAQYTDVVKNANRDTLLFCDRFPFRYLTDDYGLTYYAAFPGCSAETKASFETVAFLADKVNTLGLHCVLTLEDSDGKLAQTVITASGAQSVQVLAMDSMQAITAQDVRGGVSYLSIMEKNLEVMRQALQ